MTRKQRLVNYIIKTKYSSVTPESRQKQLAREYINGLKHLELIDLLDEVFGP